MLTKVTFPRVVKQHPDSGMVYLRAGVTIALFIAKPVHEISDELKQVLEFYLEEIPKDELKWVVSSATEEEWKAVTPQILTRLKTSLEPAGARKRKLTAFRLSDSGPDAPNYSFRLVGQPRDDDWPNAVTLVQMTLPLDAVEPANVEKCVDIVRHLIKVTEPTSGYCSPGLHFAELHADEALLEIRALAARFPGYDVQVNDMTHVHIGKRVRGARWISILGREIVKKLGGAAALRKRLSTPITVEEIGHAVMIRAGVTPELGDVNRRVDTPQLRRVAAVLEPVTLFDEIDMLSYFANFDEDVLRRWERRFLGP